MLFNKLGYCVTVAFIENIFLSFSSFIHSLYFNTEPLIYPLSICSSRSLNTCHNREVSNLILYLMKYAKLQLNCAVEKLLFFT